MLALALAALAFAPLPGWHTGASGLVPSAYGDGGRASTAWIAHDVRYRDRATADPPNATLRHLPRDGVIVWAVAWAAHDVRYRDQATADPPNRTLAHLPKDGIVVWAVLSGGGDLNTNRIHLRLSAARHLPCCEAEAVNGGVYELYGRGSIPGSTMIVRIYFGSRPTRAMRAEAQQALDRLVIV